MATALSFFLMILVCEIVIYGSYRLVVAIIDFIHKHQ
jgi:hypothetical protein